MVERIEIHLLYASLVWLAAWLLTSMPRGSATAKYWIWVVTSLNFIVPLSVVPDRLWPSYFGWFTPMGIGRLIDRIPPGAPLFVVVIWALGAAVMLIRLGVQISRSRIAPSGPAVDGILRPRIVLPAGIEHVLTERELDAV